MPPNMAGMMPQRRPQMPQQGQLSQVVYSALIEQPQIQHGWQAGVQIADRLGKVTTLVSNAILANPGVDGTKAAQFGINFEKKLFHEMPDKVGA
ncbi:hypothetical protein GGTG_01871 [Gaeumannomyces tritici R3-111a-1]|uniref:Uncharacterized protein n=1 Tax=Gaeumannomyces tritici (strain R3-111a-1) TaxID=644352 RepID=J3NKT0_GAET3|nr:hypothetical protein GGTG_01871 [Gaeumannomyces tritici R3-111a-1]EJT81897.1 hypothetical protein GGTG_01871 [Gaeumannomyces tritici R3-111a-1]